MAHLSKTVADQERSINKPPSWLSRPASFGPSASRSEFGRPPARGLLSTPPVKPASDPIAAGPLRLRQRAPSPDPSIVDVSPRVRHRSSRRTSDGPSIVDASSSRVRQFLPLPIHPLSPYTVEERRSDLDDRYTRERRPTTFSKDRMANRHRGAISSSPSRPTNSATGKSLSPMVSTGAITPSGSSRDAASLSSGGNDVIGIKLGKERLRIAHTISEDCSDEREVEKRRLLALSNTFRTKEDVKNQPEAAPDAEIRDRVERERHRDKDRDRERVSRDRDQQDGVPATRLPSPPTGVSGRKYADPWN